MRRFAPHCVVAAALALGVWVAPAQRSAAEPAQRPAAPAAQKPAASLPPSEDALGMVGSWEFSNADRDKRCTVTFSTEATRRGMKVGFDKDCAGLFPFIADIVGWSFPANDFLRLLDARGEAVLEFSEVEDRTYEAPKPGEGILFIQNPAAAGPPPRPPEQMAGQWDVVHGSGPPICTLTLAMAPAAQDLALSVTPGCDAAVTRFAPASWQMDRADLVITGAHGVTWRFGESDTPTIWQRVPESPEGLSLVRRP